MITRMTNLSSLTIAHLPATPFGDFGSLFTPHVRTLSLQHMRFNSPASMMSLVSNFQNLTSISLCYVTCLDGETLEACRNIPHNFPTLQHCTRIAWNPFSMYEDKDEGKEERFCTAMVLMKLIPHGITDLSLIAWNTHTHLVLLFIAKWGQTLVGLSLRIRGDGKWKILDEKLGMLCY